MRRRPTPPPSPLPQLHGIDPVRLRLPVDGTWETLGAFLHDRYAGGAGAAAIAGLLDSGGIVGADGRPRHAGEPYAPGAFVWFHRELPPEPEVPFPVVLVHRDEHLVVADKPHFLATTPRGSHVTETALARLRRDLGLPHLSPAHRLDRLTAGLVMFTVRPEDRGAYQKLFQAKAVHKEYEAVARHDEELAATLPRTVHSRIEKVRGVMAATEVPGPPNAASRIELLGHRAGLGHYRLLPHTGRTHQLRVHMNALGIPILGDPVYPEVTDPAPDDYTRPLQLLARRLEFTDPVTGRAHRFESTRTLAAWPPDAP
ncbi:pseudouridylate synthase [Streptomyces bambusae]|uniref:pseudouridine synthase n=1 Tax=Streptomyces bambusae TaxID=1550616 RepID=UPI001CFDA4E5|nr:pseudouridine synthase [Streptomyces bambusae]MCB5166447.1 pseudouridylate synthase [Streptomyces bambusae]